MQEVPWGMTRKKSKIQKVIPLKSSKSQVNKCRRGNEDPAQARQSDALWWGVWEGFGRKREANKKLQVCFEKART